MNNCVRLCGDSLDAMLSGRLLTNNVHPASSIRVLFGVSVFVTCYRPVGDRTNQNIKFGHELKNGDTEIC